MALDHYVSQVHLRNFYSGDGRLTGFKKSDGSQFPCRSEDICRIDEGNTNEYLTEPRYIEEFLKSVEPNYNAAVDALRNDKPDKDAVRVIAGFVAYVATCSPGAMRINTGPIENSLEAMAIMLDERGQLERAPPGLDGKSVTELLANGTIKFKIDHKFPQAVGVSNIHGRVGSFGNFQWDVLLNVEPDNPYLTSDYPIAIEASGDPRILNKIVPLAPDVAIRIRPDFDVDTSDYKNLPNAKHRTYRLKGERVRNINQMIVRCAEAQVYCGFTASWLQKFIEHHRRFRIEPVLKRIRGPRGFVMVTGQGIAPAFA